MLGSIKKAQNEKKKAREPAPLGSEKSKEKGHNKKKEKAAKTKKKLDAQDAAAAAASWIIEGDAPIDFTDPRYVQHVVCILYCSP